MSYVSSSDKVNRLSPKEEHWLRHCLLEEGFTVWEYECHDQIITVMAKSQEEADRVIDTMNVQGKLGE